MKNQGIELYLQKYMGYSTKLCYSIDTGLPFWPKNWVMSDHMTTSSRQPDRLQVFPIFLKSISVLLWLEALPSVWPAQVRFSMGFSFTPRQR